MSFRSFRLLVGFFVGFLLSAWVAFSHAETIAASNFWNYGDSHVGSYASASQACDAYVSTWPGGGVELCPTASSYLTGATSNYATCNHQMRAVGSETCGGTWTGGVYVALGCPSGQNWTLDGSSCTRPDCADGLSRGADGICSCPAGKQLVGGVCKTDCPAGYHTFTPDNGQCEKDCIGNQVQDSTGVCKCNKTANQVYSITASGSGSPGCDGGCETTAFLGTLYCPKSNFPLVGASTLPAGTQCYGYGGRTGATCTAATPPRVDVTLAPLPPPAPQPPPPAPGETAPPADPKSTVDNNKDPVACGAAGGTYLTVGGVGKCATPGPDNSMDGVKSKVTDTIKVNADGTSTITTEKTTDTINPATGQTSTTKTTSTVTKDASGNVTGTSGSTSTSTSGTKDGPGEGQCAKEPNSPMCRQGMLKEKGTFGEGQNADLTAAKQELRDKFAQVKAAVTAKFNGSLGVSAGRLPCFAPVQVLGRSFDLCFTNYSASLSPIAAYVMLAAGLLAMFIVLRR